VGLPSDAELHGEYSVMLNQTDVTFGVKGHNKYYMMQISASASTQRWYLWKKWGRVGNINGKSLVDFGTRGDVEKGFRDTFYQKTKNNWQTRKSFQAVEGKYSIVELDDASDGEEMEGPSVAAEMEGAEAAESELEPEVQELVQMVCNKQLLKDTMALLNIDTERFPLGKLSAVQLSKGYAVLADLQQAILSNKPEQIAEGTNQFYTLVPHNFGMSLPPMIDSLELLKVKIEMIECLGGIDVANSLLRETNQLMNMHPTDRQYASLKAEIAPVAAGGEEYDLVQQMLTNTRGATHKFSLKMAGLFSINRRGESGRFCAFKALHNHQLLWHGSRLSNFAGIISKGLKIAPPEAPSTGYMFGKWLYFANSSTKAAQYCRIAKSSGSQQGLLMLCQVGLGDQYECLEADSSLERAPKGYHSTWGKGKSTCDVEGRKNFATEVVANCGSMVPNLTSEESKLLYDEFIIYDEAQVNVKYLVLVDFDFDEEE